MRARYEKNDNLSTADSPDPQFCMIVLDQAISFVASLEQPSRGMHT